MNLKLDGEFLLNIGGKVMLVKYTKVIWDIFLELNFDEVVAIVSEHNNKSIKALDKLGMIHPTNNFIGPEKFWVKSI